MQVTGEYMTNYLKEMDGDDSQFKDLCGTEVHCTTSRLEDTSDRWRVAQHWMPLNLFLVLHLFLSSLEHRLLRKPKGKTGDRSSSSARGLSGPNDGPLGLFWGSGYQCCGGVPQDLQMSLSNVFLVKLDWLILRMELFVKPRKLLEDV